MINNKWIVTTPQFECDALTPEYKVWPWSGHRYFVYDLICYLQPSTIVELGTYMGTSFFTFCQAIKDKNLKTFCIAVDTWRGDEYTGSYDPKVYDKIVSTISMYYDKIHTRLLRNLFSEAVTSFEDESIDVLHIDGLHTYEAVKEDFETWYPKLAPNAIVLFHDIADSCGYGSVDYWHELLSRYPGFSFQHSWGLGVLFPKGDFYLQALKKENLDDKILVYQYASELNLMKIQKEAHEDRGDRQDALIKHQEAQIVALSSSLDRIKQSKLWPVYKKIVHLL